jgi:hypothetical protein
VPKVFLHLKRKGRASWDENTGREFLRLPCVGEYVAPGPTAPWYRVGVVVHAPFAEADYAAEVYAEEADHLEVLGAAFGD